MKENNLIGLDKEELSRLAESLGEAPFRGRQLFVQMYRRKRFSFDQMTDLSKDFRTALGQHYELRLPEAVRRTESSDGTCKYLFRLGDGRFVETVHIPEPGRDTLCISSQVGCGVGCTFCMTARMGFVRNLTPGEIVGQVLQVILDGRVAEKGFNIVFMGMGEPLYNYRNVMKAFRLLTDGEGIDLSYRKITVSTSGVVPVLQRMAAAAPPVPNLAVSINATSDIARDRVMPINRKWPLDELIEACRNFPLESRRRITFEYVLLKDENDSAEDARRLVRLLRGIPAKVNLIPYNPNPGLPHRRPDPERVDAFQRLLSEHHMAVFVRKTRGEDVAAACGQLAYLSEREVGV